MDFTEYKEALQLRYGELAKAISGILAAAINGDGGYRLQLIKERAKAPNSLHKKLLDLSMLDSRSLETDIKDLAGSRVVFYTDNDVAKFLSSGIVEGNFEVVDRKVHYPARDSEDATELYISSHFVVKLTNQRLALPEYTRFAGMQCEVQVQTILNHSWSEMAHDTIYKVPPLGDFGASHFKAIKERLAKVARKYLVPAGYEFQKIANDFESLVRGKRLHDSDALGAIVNAPDNNARADALEAFSKHVMPFFDGKEGQYQAVVEAVVAAAFAAHSTATKEITTAYGSWAGKTFDDILKACCQLLAGVRYSVPDEVFAAVRRLYPLATTDGSRRAVAELGSSLASHSSHVWETHGPAAQDLVVNTVANLSDQECLAAWGVLVTMLGEVLSANVSGTSGTSDTVSFHRGAVVASAQLEAVRAKAIDLLERLFAMASSDSERRAVLQSLHAATHMPMTGRYGAPLARLVASDACRVIDFCARVAAELSLTLRQSTEDRVHSLLRNFTPAPEWLTKDDDQLAAEWARVGDQARRFAKQVNADPDYSLFKVLVGFNSVYPPAWKDGEFGYAEAEAYREAETAELLTTVTAATAQEWLDRIRRYAQTESDDLATFPKLADFIRRASESCPEAGFAFVAATEGPLSSFLPEMLGGLLTSDQRERARALAADFIDQGRHLAQIAWHFRRSVPLDKHLLEQTLSSAMRHEDGVAVKVCLFAAADQFDSTKPDLVEDVFLPAVRFLGQASDTRWVNERLYSWLGRPILLALDEAQAKEVLDSALTHPEYGYALEYVAAAIARKWPLSVIEWFEKRREIAASGTAKPQYEVVPFDARELRAPLASHPGQLLTALRKWFNDDSVTFPYTGGRLIASVFEEEPSTAMNALESIFQKAPEANVEFIFAVLQAFEGKESIYGLVRTIVSALPPDSPHVAKAIFVLHEGGVVRGEYGFADQAQRRKVLISPWLTDENVAVREFAAKYIRDLELAIPFETRRAEQSTAMRRLAYGEDAVPPDAPATKQG